MTPRTPSTNTRRKASETGQSERFDRKNAAAKAAVRIDRRVLRTRETVQQALIALLVSKDYRAITIADICAEANVGRSTFYAHFASKEDLRRRCLEGHLREIIDVARDDVGQAPPGLNFSFSLHLFEHARQHAWKYKRNHDGAHGPLRPVFAQVIADRVRAEIECADGLSDGLEREFAVQYVVGAFMAVLHWWIERGVKLTPQQADAMFRGLVNGGLVKR